MSRFGRVERLSEGRFTQKLHISRDKISKNQNSNYTRRSDGAKKACRARFLGRTGATIDCTERKQCRVFVNSVKGIVNIQRMAEPTGDAVNATA